MAEQTTDMNADAAEKSKPQHVAREVIGKVISDRMNKTIVVQVERKVKHPLYGKYVKRFSKMYAHDEANESHSGDLVLIKQSRPLSKTKRWVLIEVLKKEDKM